MLQKIFNETVDPGSRAFRFGDAVMAAFFVQNSRLIMAEECYFFLMASMRKMRMNIPLSFTPDFFEEALSDYIGSKGISNGILQVMACRAEMQPLQKAAVELHIYHSGEQHPLAVQGSLELDIMKELTVNTHLLSNLRVHCPENIYAEIYARENDLDDLILLNPQKRIARSIYGNLLFLQDGAVTVPKQSEGAYISPLMENFVTYLHKNRLAEITEAELNAFESQKAQEILMISDFKGIFTINKIRNKVFAADQFAEWIAGWQETFRN